MMFLPPYGVPTSHPHYDMQQQRVYVTSLANIASSSPSRKNWSRRNGDDDPPLRPAQKFFDRILHRKRNENAKIVDDSVNISDSKRLQLSIIAEQGTAATNREIYCCSTDEGDCVVRKMKKTAASHLSDGNLEDALQMLNKCLAFQQKLHGKRSVEVADTFNMMGTVMANMGTDYNFRAMNAFERALKIYQDQIGFGSEEAAACLKNLYLLLHQERVYISISRDEEEEEEDKAVYSCQECHVLTEVTRNPM